MRPGWRLVCALVLVSACGAKGGDSAAPPPAVAGRYQVFVTTVSGCDNDATLVQPWAQGPLTVSQDGAALTLDYGDGAVLDGSIEGDGGFTATGAHAWSGRELSIRQEGDFVEDGDVWTLSARFRILVSEDEFESNDCTLEADIDATQIAD